MKLTIRNIDLKTSNLIDKNISEMKKQGIKITKEEYVTKLINEGLYADFNQYKKDIFDKTIKELTDKFSEFNESNNELISILIGGSPNEK
ncbi:hypothetical protein ACPBEH_11485 (plasmid) [Latilactobacillus sp. 5-91]|uniref:hypothetical protein n=1 Tax=Latilactobacillus sp. 5-91 TaxID=3410924 RepID=UPI003C7475F0